MSDWLNAHWPDRMTWAFILIVLHAVVDVVTILARTSNGQNGNGRT